MHPGFFAIVVGLEISDDNMVELALAWHPLEVAYNLRVGGWGLRTSKRPPLVNFFPCDLVDPVRGEAVAVFGMVHQICTVLEDTCVLFMVLTLIKKPFRDFARGESQTLSHRTLPQGNYTAAPSDPRSFRGPPKSLADYESYRPRHFDVTEHRFHAGFG